MQPPQARLPDFVFVGIPKVAGGVLTFALHLALLRFLGTEQFGIYSLCISWILIVDAIIGGPIDMGVIRTGQVYLRDDPAKTIAVEQAALWMKLVLTITLGVSLTIAARPLSERVFETADNWPLVPVSCVVVMMILLLRTAQLHLQIRHRFLAYGLTEALHIIVKFGGIALILALVQVRPLHLLLFFALGPFVAALTAILTNGRQLLTRASETIQAGRKLLDITKWYLATVSLGAVINQMDIVMLGWLAPLEQVGIYAAGQVIASIPTLLGTYLGIVLMPKIIPYCHSGTFHAFFKKVQILLLAAAVIGYFIVVQMWDWVVPALLPTAYVASGKILFILLPATLAAMATVPLALGFVLFVNKRLLFLVDCAVFPSLLVAYSVVIPRYGDVGAAWITCGSFFLRSGLVQFFAWRWARNPQVADSALG